jgi:hypothetical protein
MSGRVGTVGLRVQSRPCSIHCMVCSSALLQARQRPLVLLNTSAGQVLELALDKHLFEPG